MGLARFIKRGSIMQRGRRCRGHLGYPLGVSVGSLRILGVRVTRCLGEILRRWRLIWPIRRGYSSTSRITKELGSFAIGTIDRHIGDVNIVARPVALTGVMIRPVKRAGPSLLAATFLVGMVGGYMKPTKFVFVLRTGTILGLITAGSLASVTFYFVTRALGWGWKLCLDVMQHELLLLSFDKR